MSYGMQITNGQNNVIIDETIEPYVIHSSVTVNLTTDGAAVSGFKFGSVTMPSQSAILLLPWNATVKGGAVEWVNGSTARFVCMTTATSLKAFIATPTAESTFQTYTEGWGLRIQGADAKVIYDSRKPFLQVTSHFYGVPPAVNTNSTFDVKEANYVAQSCLDLGVVSYMYGAGFITRQSDTQIRTSVAWQEDTRNWDGNPSNIRDLSIQTQCSALFARITI